MIYAAHLDYSLCAVFFLLQIRQKGGYDAKQRGVSADIIYIDNSEFVGKIAKYGGDDASYAEGESKEQARNHSEFIRQKFLCVEQYGRECRRQHKSGSEAQYGGQRQRYVWQK